MFKKILWVLLAIAAGLGLLLCVAGLIGAWVVNPPVTSAITTTAEAAESYLALAGNATETASNELESLRIQLDAIGARVEGLSPEARSAVAEEVASTFQTRFGPTVSGLRASFATLRTAIVAFNQTLENANRIPGVTVPTLTDELQAANQRIDTINSSIDEIKASVADVSVDGSKISAMIASASAEITSIEQLANSWSNQITGVSAGIGTASAAAPGIIDMASVVLSLLLILFGAGQVCMLLRAVQGLRS